MSNALEAFRLRHAAPSPFGDGKSGLPIITGFAAWPSYADFFHGTGVAAPTTRDSARLRHSRAMPIPENQLLTWTTQGGTTAAKTSHESIRTALSAESSPVRNHDFTVFLQGSYKNDTNIRGDSDVDVVVQLNKVWERDISQLTQTERDSYLSCVSRVPYGSVQFRADVITALTRYYGDSAVSPERKCITVRTGPANMTADVIACIEYHWYTRFQSLSDQQYWDGIAFYTSDGRTPIVNYPRLHYENGVAKNSVAVTNGWYKPTVRLFKNARNHLIDNYGYPEDHAPSYFTECLLYNVPNQLFGGSFAGTFAQALAWLNAVDFQGFICQNGMTPLFGTDITQWRADHAKELVRALSALWSKW